jgi:hypothetical protein
MGMDNLMDSGLSFNEYLLYEQECEGHDLVPVPESLHVCTLYPLFQSHIQQREFPVFLLDCYSSLRIDGFRIT